MDSQMTERHSPRPRMTWVEVADAHGGTHLEARWSTAAPASSASHAA